MIRRKNGQKNFNKIQQKRNNIDVFSCIRSNSFDATTILIGFAIHKRRHIDN